MISNIREVQQSSTPFADFKIREQEPFDTKEANVRLPQKSH